MTVTKTAAAPPPEAQLQLLRLMEDLIAVMEREIVAVETRLHEELPELVNRKQRLLVDYQAEYKAATQNPAWLKSLPETQKSLLRKLGETMRDAGERNARAVKAAVTGTQRLLHGIMASVRDEKCQKQGYGHLVQPDAVPAAQSVIFKTTA